MPLVPSDKYGNGGFSVPELKVFAVSGDPVRSEKKPKGGGQT